LLISRVPGLEMDNSTDSFLHPDDPIRAVYQEFRRQFGRDERITVAVEAPDLFDADFLERLRALHEDLENEVPHIEDLVSMVNARNTRGEDDELIVEDLLEDWPETAAQRAALRERVAANPLYRNTLVSRDMLVTVVSIELVAYAGDGAGDLLGGFDEAPAAEASDEREFLPEREISKAVRAARAVVERHQAPGFHLRIAGAPVMSERINTRMQEDMRRFTALAVLAIGAFLFLLFRTVAAVLLPLMVVVLSMLSTLGVMAFAGGTLTETTQILPSFLLAVGVGDSVHILAIFYQRLSEGHSREDAIASALGHSGLAVLMTSLTTAGGLGAFAAGQLKPVADLGIYAPFGVMFALLFTVVLLPALLMLFPSRPRRRRSGQAEDRVTRVLQRLGDVAAGHPWSIVTLTTAVLGLAVMGAFLLRFSHNPMDWFPESEEFRDATLFMNERLDGVNVVEVVVRTEQENGVQDPELLRRLEQLRLEVARIHRGEWHVGKTVSLADVVKEIHQALNENRPDYYTLPADRELVAQALLLFENRRPGVPGGTRRPRGSPASRAGRRGRVRDHRSGADAGTYLPRHAREHGAVVRDRDPGDRAADGPVDRQAVPRPAQHDPEPDAGDPDARLDGLDGAGGGRHDHDGGRHRDRSVRGRHHPLHAQLPPLLRPVRRCAGGDPPDPSHHRAGAAGDLAGAGGGLLHLPGCVHVQRPGLRPAGRERHPRGVLLQRAAGVGPPGARHPAAGRAGFRPGRVRSIGRPSCPRQVRSRRARWR
jgi:predicted RND superfamily exporter protein